MGVSFARLLREELYGSMARTSRLFPAALLFLQTSLNRCDVQNARPAERVAMMQPEGIAQDRIPQTLAVICLICAGPGGFMSSAKVTLEPKPTPLNQLYVFPCVRLLSCA